MLHYNLRVSTLFTALFVTVLLFSACENDINKIREISAKEINTTVQQTTGVDVIYSDSARVKIHLTAPLMLDYTQKAKPYTVMPKGVKVQFFNDSLKASSTVVADSAVNLQAEKLIKLYHNVVATNDKGETFKSDELIWDQNTKKLHSDKQVQIRMADGTVMNGTRFESNQSLWPWTLDQSTGVIQVNGQAATQ